MEGRKNFFLLFGITKKSVRIGRGEARVVTTKRIFSLMLRKPSLCEISNTSGDVKIVVSYMEDISKQLSVMLTFFFKKNCFKKGGIKNVVGITDDILLVGVVCQQYF